MSFITINSSRYQTGAPAATGLFSDIVSDLNFLNGVNTSSVDAGGAPLILNGSFESPAVASSTTPNNWTIVAGDAGAAVMINTDQDHGAQSLKFTRDNTAGHTGGTATTDFFNVSGGPTTNSGSSYMLTFMIKSSATDVSNTVVVNWYAADQSSLSSTTVYSETAGIASWVTRSIEVVPPATACFGKLVLSGGTATTNPASTRTILFDGISMRARSPMIAGVSFTASGTWTVPNGVFNARVRISASSYNVGKVSSGNGGYCEGKLVVYPGQAVAITISTTGLGNNTVVATGNTTLLAQNGGGGLNPIQGTASGGYLNMTGGSVLNITGASSGPLVVIEY